MISQKIVALIGLAFLAGFVGFGCAHKSESEETVAKPKADQITFDSPGDAVNALVTAVTAHDKSQAISLFGADGADLVNSGDDVADRQAGEKFLTAFNQKHQIQLDATGKTATLVIGDNDWPFPIPIAKDATIGKWAFDTDAGKDEVINRRIGRNELDVIQVCKAICDAQQDYVQRDPDNNGIEEYAAKFVSDPGKKNGLYWPTAEGETPSPLGPFVADATEEGYKIDPAAAASGQTRPYHGYLYKMLTAQGPHAEGGATDYVVNGKLIGGFAVVAWPADYGNSGITTFITNYKGDVYQKDLGDDTDKLAKAMTAFDPDPSWKKAE